MPRKCKKGNIWDNKNKECRPPTRDEKWEMALWREAKHHASFLGTSTGAAGGGLIGAAVGQPLIGAALGAAYNRKRAINIQKHQSDPPYTNVPSRNIPREYRRKKKK